MKDQLGQRLHDLRAEFESGQRQMVLLDQRRQELQHTLLRISGAIQVLEELLAQEQAEASGDEAGNNATMRAVRS